MKELLLARTSISLALLQHSKSRSKGNEWGAGSKSFPTYHPRFLTYPSDSVTLCTSTVFAVSSRIY